MKPSLARKARYLAQSTALMLAVSAVCVFGVILASREPIRLDTTASREHELSERSRRVLQSLDAPHEIVLVVNAAAADPRALERAQDVLDTLARESPFVSATSINASSGRGAEALDAVLARLVERYRPTLDSARSAITSAAESAQSLAADYAAAAILAQNAADAVSAEAPSAAELRRFFSDSAAVLRLAGPELAAAADQARQHADSNAPNTPIPLHERAVARLREPVLNIHRQMDEINSGLLALEQARPGVIDDPTRAAAKSLLERCAPLRDRTASLLLAVEDVPATPLERCLRALSAGPTALIIGPPPKAESNAAAGARGVTAVDVQSLLLPAASGDPTLGRIDLRFRIEELFVGGLAVLNVRTAPVVCLVHGAREGETLAPEFAPLRGLVQRLALRGIDVVEWPAALQDAPPSLSRLPGGSDAGRPVIYAVLPTNALTPDGALRSKRLADRVAALVAEGKPVLLSVNPSNLPGIGQKDPMVEFLEPLGLRADSGRPILQRVPNADRGGTGAQPVFPDLFLTRADPSTAIGQAVQSLRTHLRWGIPLRIDPTAQQKSGTQIRAVLVVPASENTWAESEWLGFWQLSASDRLRVSNPPAPHPVRDDLTGPWTVVASIDRASDGAKSSAIGRIVVVGANAWFFDEFTQTADVIDGRPVARSPGNAELFEAAIYWLAGQEDLIARSAEAQAAPTIRGDLSERSQTLLRWSLIAGLPLLTLLVGAFWRLVRG